MTTRRTLGTCAVMVASLVAGCRGGLPEPRSVADMNAARASAGAKFAAEMAPQAFADAERHREAALAAAKDGDTVVADLEAERAVAGYERARALGRLAVATRELASAEEDGGRASAALREAQGARKEIDRRAEALASELKVARESAPLAASGPAGPEREAARRTAARSLAAQGRLLCGAAKLLAGGTGEGPLAATVTAAEGDLSKVERVLEGAPKVTPIDDAARVRAACLTALTHVRREGRGRGDKGPPAGVAGQGDALLSELSATGKWSASRDERGVVVVLHGAFRGTTLTPEARGRLEELGRVAVAHPTMPLQVVTHDARPEGGTGGVDRAKAAAAALQQGGAPTGALATEAARTHLPAVDPDDAKLRDKNARLEVVFVSP